MGCLSKIQNRQSDIPLWYINISYIIQAKNGSIITLINYFAFYLKGDNHTVESNLAYDDNDNTHCSLCVPTHHGDYEMNKHTVVINNAASRMEGGGGVIQNNYVGLDVKNHLEDPDVQDFRPIEGGALTQGDIVMGPYQPGVGEGFYWIPGINKFLTLLHICREGVRNLRLV